MSHCSNGLGSRAPCVPIPALWTRIRAGATVHPTSTTAAVARTDITADGDRIEFVEQRLDRGGLRRSFRNAGGTTLYRSITRAGAGGLGVQVLEGHASRPRYCGAGCLTGPAASVSSNWARAAWACGFS